jgi:hypothetical protein
MLSWLRREWQWQRAHHAAWAEMTEPEANGLSRFQAACWQTFAVACHNAGRAVPEAVRRALDDYEFCLTGRLADGRGFFIYTDSARVGEGVFGEGVFENACFQTPADLWTAFVMEALGPVSPEEADRMATLYFERQGFRGAYRVDRVAELPELKKLYYLTLRDPPRERLDDGAAPLGSGGLFVSLDTREIEDPGSGALLYASFYLRARDQLPVDVEPSLQELAALLARHSAEQLIAMWRGVEREREGGSP